MVATTASGIKDSGVVGVDVELERTASARRAMMLVGGRFVRLKNISVIVHICYFLWCPVCPSAIYISGRTNGLIQFRV